MAKFLSGKVGLIAVPAVLALVIGGLVYFRGWIPHSGPRMTAAEAVLLIEEKNVALGQLENAQFDKSQPAFAALAEKTPEEELPVRNELLGWLWALSTEAYTAGHAEPGQREAAIERAQQRLARLRELSDNIALSFYFEARLDEARGDDAAAIGHLRQAAAADPTTAIYPGRLYELLRLSSEPGADEEALAALKTALKLSPRNLYLLTELVVRQTSAQDPQITQTLEVLREEMSPFFGTVKDQMRFDAASALDRALAAAREGNWSQVSGQTSQLRNISLSLPVRQFDKVRIDPHELEFVMYDFSAKFYDGVELGPPSAPEPIAVNLAPAGDSWKLLDMADALATSVADFDLDGRWDVIVVRPQRVEIHGRKAADVTWRLLAAYDLPSPMTGVLAADLDRDIRDNVPLAPAAPLPGEQPAGEQPYCARADVDLVLYGPEGVLLLKNVYDQKANTRSLQAMTGDAALAALKNGITAVAADVDHDGDVDLVFSAEDGMSLWSNRENFTFENITRHSQPPSANFRVTKIVPVDWDRDVYLDLVLGDDSGSWGVWKNYGHRNFRWEETTQPAGASKETADAKEDPARQAGPTVLDADGNVAWDVVSGGEGGVSLTLNGNPRAGVVRSIKNVQVTDKAVQGSIAWDYDNDGYQDLLTWSDQGAGAWRAMPDGSFQAAGSVVAEAPQNIRSAQAADFDQDGDLDVLFETGAGPQLYLNQGGNTNHWLSLSLGGDLEAQLPRERVNMHGLGSLMELKAGSLYQPRVVEGQITHLGLGQRQSPDVVRVVWTNGVPQNLVNPITGQAVCLEQRLKGSCPYVYAWDGRQWIFYTDCLWAAPLGLQFARGVLAPAREWEYLTIDGEALAEDNGHYRLMLTEELWEAAYFDQVKLIAVDHPADVEICSNEKVGPAEVAQFRIHTVRNPREPVAARNHRGRDVLELVAKRDKKFVQLFDVGHRQGLVEPHFLEIDLGELDHPKQITLFLRGWMWPTDTSLNLAIDENPELDGPRPPSLWVPSEEGEWIEAIPYLGFPGGKTKTMAVDISDVFPTDDYRVRIQTSMEIYWDAVWFSLDEQAAETREQEAPLVAAELRYRGFSQRSPRQDNGPEGYDASYVDPAPQWPPMLGAFTHYGDATDLVREQDNQLAVFGAGDALEIQFQKPPQDPPSGWKRDFLLYNVGWDKDADLNTVAGQTAEPFPFTGMLSYPPADQPATVIPQLRSGREQPRSPFWRQVRDAHP